MPQSLRVKMRIVAFALGLAVVFAGDSIDSVGRIAASAFETDYLPHSNIDAQIAEATFRYQFQHNASGQQTRAYMYCIGYGSDPSRGGKPYDPPTAFLARFADVGHPVRASSQCTTNRKTMVIDRKTRKESLIFTIQSAKYTGNSKCEIEGGYYEADLSSSSDTYYLEHRAGTWTVTKDVMAWIS